MQHTAAPPAMAAGMPGGAGGGGPPPKYPMTVGSGFISPLDYVSPAYQSLMHLNQNDPGGGPPGGPGGGGGGGGGGDAASPDAVVGSGDPFKNFATLRFGQMYSVDRRKKVESFTLRALPEARRFLRVERPRLHQDDREARLSRNVSKMDLGGRGRTPIWGRLL